MADQIPAPAAPAAPAVVPAVVVPPAQPSALQVLSATLQNLAVIIVLGYAWLLGKLDTTVAVVALLLVVGIDFANRRRLPGASAAVAFGATGVLHALGVTGTAAVVALAFAGCGAAPAADLAPAKTAIAASESVYELACTNPQVYALIPKECEAAYTAVTAAVQAYNAADKAATEAASK